MARETWNDNRFLLWDEETHIPEDVMKMVDIVCEQLGIEVEETIVRRENRGGYTYAYAKGFILSHCTSSMEDGPSADMTPVFMKWLGGLGFAICRSYGDNGLDSATNWHDTYWTTEIAYKPTEISADFFYDFPSDEEYDY